MTRPRPHRLRRPVAGHANKGLPAALTSGANGQIRSAADIAALAGQQMVGGVVNPLPRDPGFNADFGPNTPLIPAALDPVRRDSGRPEPRISEYPVSWNLPGTRGSHVPWRILRDAADLPIISDCIRIRKEEVATLDWEIGISRKAVMATQRGNPGVSRRTAENDLRKRLMPEIDRLRSFWEEPDAVNGLHFPAWIAQFLDERLVLDAVAIWPRRSLGGDVIGLALLDGSTIKPLLDEYGGRPSPPNPAFQQILYGFPRGEFTADTVETEHGTVIPGAFASDQLIYEVRDRRTWTPYGRSPVEAALLDLDTWMKRVEWLRSEYTDGVMPSGWLLNKGGAGATEWGPAQVLEYEMALNDLYGGDTAQRRRFRVLPPGIEPDMSPEVGEKFKADYDLHLLKLLVAHFDLTIYELGFTETQGLGSAGHSQGQLELNERKGSTPTLRALQAILTRISRRHLGMPEELEWRWTKLATDDAQADTTVAEQVAAGLLTFNEGRDELGRPRFDFLEADMAAIIAPRTGAVTFLNGSSTPPPPSPVPGQPNIPQGDTVGAPAKVPAGQKPEAGPAGSVARANDNTVRGDPGRSGTSRNVAARDAQSRAASKKSADPEDDAAKVAEANAYRKWATKSHTRRFTLEHIATPTDLDIYGIDPAKVTFVSKAGDADPKGRRRRHSDDSDDIAVWPGWVFDEQTADYWAGELRSALTGALPLHTLAADWSRDQRHHPQHGDDTPSAAIAASALAFLLASGVADTLTARMTPVLGGAGTEGWVIGQRSAQAVLDGTSVEWGDWSPGHPATARTLVDDPDALAAYLRGVDVADMATTRVERLAAVMGQAVAENWTVDRLTAAMRQVLDDPATARATASAVVVGASGVVTLAVYRAVDVSQVRWVTDPRSNVCPVCLANEAAGVVEIGTVFPSGDQAPPAHPNCMCAVVGA